MPIAFYKEVSSKVKWAVWKIVESIEDFQDQLHPSDEDSVGSNLVEKKKLETIATRLLVKKLVEDSGNTYYGLYKDEHGKPHLTGHDEIYVSISHAYPYAAAIIDFSEPTGIDIEARREQIFRIKHKFLSPEEMQHQDDIDHLTIIWAAKETLYKIHGRKKLLFKSELKVTFEHDQGLIGRIILPDQIFSYELEYQRIADHWLVFKTGIL